MRYVVPPEFWVFLREVLWKNFQTEARGGTLIRCLNHPIWLLFTQRNSGPTPSSLQSFSHYLSGIDQSPKGWSLFSLLYLNVNIGWLVNQELCLPDLLPLYQNRPTNCQHYCWHTYKMPGHLILQFSHCLLTRSRDTQIIAWSRS